MFTLRVSFRRPNENSRYDALGWDARYRMVTGVVTRKNTIHFHIQGPFDHSREKNFNVVDAKGVCVCVPCHHLSNDLPIPHVYKDIRAAPSVSRFAKPSYTYFSTVFFFRLLRYRRRRRPSFRITGRAPRIIGRITIAGCCEHKKKKKKTGKLIHLENFDLTPSANQPL